jgi:hypothetical protein
MPNADPILFYTYRSSYPQRLIHLAGEDYDNCITAVSAPSAQIQETAFSHIPRATIRP